jgi:hypothetical protein
VSSISGAAEPKDANGARDRTREIAREVLLEAFGASATPFVPVPFVDDWMLARLLRRIAAKVLARHGITSSALPKAIVDAYVEAGAPSTASTVLVGAARFVVRKLAVVLDVKKSHDVFGESIAFALGLDVAVPHGWANEAGAAHLGAAMYRTLQIVGSGALEALVRAARDGFARGGDRSDGDKTDGPSPTRLDHLSEAIAGEVERARNQLEPVLRFQVTGRTSP